MKLKGPIITLAVGAAVAVGLLVANMTTTGGESTTAVATSAPAVTTSASPSPTASAAASPAAGVAPAAAPAVATYADRVGGGLLAISIEGESVIAYFCDGVNESWLWGKTSGTSVSAKNKSGDSLTGTRGGGKVVGSLTVDDKTWKFTTPSVKKPSGLYRATAQVRGATYVGGWVVLADGRQVGSYNVNGVPSGQPAPAINTDTGQVTIDGNPLVASEPNPEEAPGG